MKSIMDTPFAKILTNRTINEIRFEGDLIQNSEILKFCYFWEIQ